MPPRDDKVLASTHMPARYLAILCDLLKGCKVDADALLRAARIPAAQIYGPDAKITVAQLQVLLANAIKISGRTDLGFLLGRQIKLSSHELLGYGMLTSPTIEHALRLAARYFRLITPTYRMQYLHDAESVELRFEPTLVVNPQTTQFLIETIVISTHGQIESMLQRRLPSCEVYVSYPEPPHSARYRELLPTRFHYRAESLPGARMVIKARPLTQALPMADRSALKMAQDRCEDLLRNTVLSVGITAWVTMMLREAREASPTLDELSHLLNQSPRTLDRHLAREGSRFLELSKRVRHEKACELLRAGSLPITQVAYQLGYKDAANFTRAFRRESGGQTPSQFQSRRRGATGRARSDA